MSLTDDVARLVRDLIRRGAATEGRWEYATAVIGDAPQPEGIKGGYAYSFMSHSAPAAGEHGAHDARKSPARGFDFVCRYSDYRAAFMVGVSIACDRYGWELVHMVTKSPGPQVALLRRWVEASGEANTEVGDDES